MKPDPFPYVKALEELRQRLKKTSARFLILTHDNPDPDSLAAAWGLERLLRSNKIKAEIGIGGIIGRAENRAMVRELQVKFTPIEQLDLTRFEGFALVDTQPGTGNNSLPGGRKPDIVVDHHPQRPGSKDVPWCDIRPDLGATATIVYGYLKRSGIPLDPALATAFLYAIKTETKDLGREATPDERVAYVELMTMADFNRLHAITSPKLSRDHFVVLDRALRSATSYGQLVTINLGILPYPDLVAEVADLMLSYENAKWVMCVGSFKNHAHVSLRTDLADGGAGYLIRRMVGSDGAAGGHGMTAGGRMHAALFTPADLASVYDKLVKKMLTELRIRAKASSLLDN